ncbi:MULTISPECIES: phage holin [Staphylococcus]|uniref:phage holin n=1 Tax=Staphylococcus TaxID=1279 RepID=UPI000929853F|nr:phage holin [Staphylococcus ureilyticus]OJT35310.1 phage holin [Staphylococcus ureilyticus]RNM28026.1 phage holin [Staphylococcus cohnii]
MNFILRLKNKATLTAIVGAILLFIKQITEAFGVDLSAQIEQVSGLIGAIITFLVGIGVVTDPTTKGVKDSGITKTYAKPRDENENPVEYQKAVSDEKVTPERKELTPEEFDTSEPFTDDTDEVEFDVADYEYDEELKRGASRYHDDEVLKVSDEDGR